MEPWLIILLVVAAFLALGIFIWLCIAAFRGAVFLFAYAGGQGFIGLAVYIACWVFFSPVMLIICIVIGLSLMWESREE